MKKLSLFILIVLMLFAFVACNPNSSSSSASSGDETLPGEVTPPAESERKSMSDADIVKVAGYWDILWSDDSDITEVARERKIEFDFGENGTLSIKSNEDWKDSLKAGDSVATVTANGKITIESGSYVVDNLELVGKVKSTSAHMGEYDYSVEKGSITKDGVSIDGADNLYNFLFVNTDRFYKDSHLKAYSEEENKQTKFQFFDDKGKTIGIGTEIERITETKDEDEHGVWVYDFTINGSRIQAKMRQTGEVPSIDYVALDGVFFDKASCDKLLPLIY